MTINVRDATPDDAPFLRDALTRLADEMRSLEVRRYAPDSVFVLSISQMLKRDNFLIAESDGVSCGFLSIYFPYPSANKAVMAPDADAHLQTLFVLPQHRRRGIGTRLLEKAYETCRESGARGISLHVLEGNAAAQALYAKMGYRPISRSMRLPFAQQPEIG